MIIPQTLPLKQTPSMAVFYKLNTMRRALIVDDEEDIGFIVSKLLKKEGMTVSYASSIGKGRQLLSSQEFDVVFLDLHLPDGTGFDLVPKIQQQQKKAKIIIISAFDGVEESRKSNEFGIKHFIKKPFDRHQVMEAVAV